MLKHFYVVLLLILTLVLATILRFIRALIPIPIRIVLSFILALVFPLTYFCLYAYSYSYLVTLIRIHIYACTCHGPVVWPQAAAHTRVNSFAVVQFVLGYLVVVIPALYAGVCSNHR